MFILRSTGDEIDKMKESYKNMFILGDVFKALCLIIIWKKEMQYRVFASASRQRKTSKFES